jgi:homoserine dehydrogenase
MTRIVQIGLGGVGQALVRQLQQQRNDLRARYGIELRYAAVSDSSAVLSAAGGLSDALLDEALALRAAGQRLANHAAAQAGSWQAAIGDEPLIIVDVSAAAGMAAPLAAAAAAGHRVVLANKRPLCEAAADFAQLTAHGAARYEATVGAGLPVIGTLQALIDSGDRIERIEAAMSGTLGYLASELQQGTPFSAAVRAAHALGYTEPDPRDDLSGADVARKAQILGRTVGWGWAADSVAAEALYPEAFAALSREAFLAQLDALDAGVEAQRAAAAAEGKVLRYTAALSAEGVEVGLRALAADHPLAGLRGADNLFSFTTARYATRPLVVRGPGAGLEVTAAGVLADIIAHARELGS